MTRSGLHETIRGRVLEPGDAGYDTARTVWNAMIDRRPRYIVQCADDDDVVASVRFATDHDLDLGIRCGGHGIVGHAVADGGLMIDLRPMGDVTVDPSTRRARVQGGALLGALDVASQQHGLATTAGNVSHTGVGGLTLGGGMGWLARQHGLACDNVISFEVVTATGEKLRVSADEHPELYWALRGGGGNFGVVTEFEFALHPEPGHAITAAFRFPLATASQAMRRWRDLNASAPRQATFEAIIGMEGVSLGLVWVGDPDDGDALISELADELADVAEPDLRSVKALSYLELQTREDDIEGHAWRRYWKGHYFSELGDDLIDALLARDGDDLPDVSLQAYGGAIADVADEETAFSRRDTAFELVAASRWTDPDDDVRRISAARNYAAPLGPFASGAYVNVLGDDGDAGIRRAFSEENLRRLVAVKDAYDPGNLFHLNQNIRPSGA
ncbi:FAD-binding oxidoreductase [Agromyces sp. ISL-38]|uniref:FAD-binding oxidoreductase n=1 Tax=Agromyces sp. ISL-38 TaxID=2819107 RepID=UPI001BEC9197|nr:FAD-binding oxidoreductase [Agromyces sp. ISL-38]MBT2498424.1 FAD-binding oxidoreductase [Agromyces sp. ISL-38]MBT2518800.1 FAD-binding oxidoreductase [Streptomyces sp. ISL-90]